MKKGNKDKKVSDTKSCVNANFRMSPNIIIENSIKKVKRTSKYRPLDIISDDVVNFINKYAEKHVVDEEYKNTSIF